MCMRERVTDGKTERTCNRGANKGARVQDVRKRVSASERARAHKIDREDNGSTIKHEIECKRMNEGRIMQT